MAWHKSRLTEMLRCYLQRGPVQPAAQEREGISGGTECERLPPNTLRLDTSLSATS